MSSRPPLFCSCNDLILKTVIIELKNYEYEIVKLGYENMFGRTMMKVP